MGSSLPRITFRSDEITIKKLNTIAELEYRPTNKQLELIVKNFISKYEEENGEIKIEEGSS